MSIKTSAQGKPWGKITWFFLHTFAERIDESFLNTNKAECLSIISNTCSMIPCPTCRNHAMQYLKSNPINKYVNNKQDLKKYLFLFHNQATLNGNPRASIVDISILDQYSKANFPNIVKAFSAEYMKKTPTRLDYTHTLFSQRILNTTLDFLRKNEQYFIRK